jgi:hypothetical protein
MCRLGAMMRWLRTRKTTEMFKLSHTYILTVIIQLPDYTNFCINVTSTTYSARQHT